VVTTEIQVPPDDLSQPGSRTRRPAAM